MKLIIRKKPSETGTIHDLASEHEDIVLHMGDRYRYAVGAPSRYKVPWTRHVSEDAALRAYGKLKKAKYEGVVLLRSDAQEAQVGYAGGHVERWHVSPEAVLG